MPESIRPRIMLVEDDADLRTGWSDVFDLIDIEYSTYSRGQEALRDFDAVSSSHVIVTDYYLPDLNGVEVVKQVRKLNPSIGAIVLTGSKESSVVGSIHKIENCSLLHKPLNIDILEAEIRKIFERHFQQ